MKMVVDGSYSFESKKVPELQNFLKAKDNQIALDRRKGKGLNSWRFAKMQVPEVDEEIELKDDLIKSKITLPGEKLLH